MSEPMILALSPSKDGFAPLELLPRMAEVAAPGGWLIASGILAERTDEALLSLSAAGFRPVKVLKEGEWIAVRATRQG